MKKIIICSLLLVLTNVTFSQQKIPSPTLTKQDYVKKSKSQNTLAYVFLGTGIIMAASGIVINFSTNLRLVEKNAISSLQA